MIFTKGIIDNWTKHEYYLIYGNSCFYGLLDKFTVILYISRLAIFSHLEDGSVLVSKQRAYCSTCSKLLNRTHLYYCIFNLMIDMLALQTVRIIHIVLKTPKCTVVL